MNIILGVFSKGFWKTKSKLDLTSFSFNWPALDVNYYSHYANDLIEYVHGGCQLADTIYFDLTYIKFKIDSDSFENSITLNELLLVISTPELLAKTVFIKRNKTLNKDEVVNKFLFNDYWNQFLN